MNGRVGGMNERPGREGMGRNEELRGRLWQDGELGEFAHANGGRAPIRREPFAVTQR